MIAPSRFWKWLPMSNRPACERRVDIAVRGRHRRAGHERAAGDLCESLAAECCGKNCGGQRERCAMQKSGATRAAARQKFRNGPEPQPHSSPPFCPGISRGGRASASCRWHNKAIVANAKCRSTAVVELRTTFFARCACNVTCDRTRIRARRSSHACAVFLLSCRHCNRILAPFRPLRLRRDYRITNQNPSCGADCSGAKATVQAESNPNV